MLCTAWDAWHCKLGSGAGLSKGQVALDGIYGMILNIMDAANDVQQSQKVISEIESLLFVQNSTRRSDSCQSLSRNCLLVNLMLLRSALQRGRRCNTWICRHICHLDTEVTVLTTVQLEVYVTIFVECGMELFGLRMCEWKE